MISIRGDYWLFAQLVAHCETILATQPMPDEAFQELTARIAGRQIHHGHSGARQEWLASTG